MPCQDGLSITVDRRDYYEMHDRLNLATKAACDLARVIQKRYPKVWKRMSHCPEGTKGLPLLRRETLKWIKAHDKLDAERIKYVKEKKKRQRMKKLALAKLTPEERKLLGI